MANYLVAYHGGGVPESPEESARSLGLWGDWYTSLGAAVADPGQPVGQARTIASTGSVSAGGGANPVSGYTIITADSIDSAVSTARGCPLLASGGSIEVAETFEMG